MSRAHDLWGAGKHDTQAGLNRVFPDGALAGSVPWPVAGRNRSRPKVDYTKQIPKTLREAPEGKLTQLDPRKLFANQGGLSRQGVSHYSSGDYERTGRTFADHEQVGNRVPVVYRRPSTRVPGTTEDVIMSGHHRAAAALLQARQFSARVVEGP